MGIGQDLAAGNEISSISIDVTGSNKFPDSNIRHSFDQNNIYNVHAKADGSIQGGL